MPRAATLLPHAMFASCAWPQVSEALVQFEYSRQGLLWSAAGSGTGAATAAAATSATVQGGAALAVDGFAPHAQLLARAEVLATLGGGGGEAGRAAAVAEASARAEEAARQAADARFAAEVAQVGWVCLCHMARRA